MLKPRYSTIKNAVSGFKDLLGEMDGRHPKDTTISVITQELLNCFYETIDELSSFEDLDEAAADHLTKMRALGAMHSKDPEATQKAVAGGKALVASLRKKAAAEKGPIARGASNFNAETGAKDSARAKSPPPIPDAAKRKAEAVELPYMQEFKRFAGLDDYEAMPFDPGRLGSTRILAPAMPESTDIFEDEDVEEIEEGSGSRATKSARQETHAKAVEGPKAAIQGLDRAKNRVRSDAHAVSDPLEPFSDKSPNRASNMRKVAASIIKGKSPERAPRAIDFDGHFGRVKAMRARLANQKK